MFNRIGQAVLRTSRRYFPKGRHRRRLTPSERQLFTSGSLTGRRSSWVSCETVRTFWQARRPQSSGRMRWSARRKPGSSRRSHLTNPSPTHAWCRWGLTDAPSSADRRNAWVGRPLPIELVPDRYAPRMRAVLTRYGTGWRPRGLRSLRLLMPLRRPGCTEEVTP